MKSRFLTNYTETSFLSTIQMNLRRCKSFDFSVSFIVLMLMNGLVNLATTLPAAPGYIGTFDTPGIATLASFGVDPSVAAGYTFTLHAALWIPVTLLGAYYFWREHLRLSDVEVARQQAEKAADVQLEADAMRLTTTELDALAAASRPKGTE